MLEGFKVVELATYIAAPVAAGILADWGADVIKVEPPAGDPMRWLRAQAPGGCSPVFETNNRGKRSVALDLNTPLGREAMGRLLAEADVFVTNLRPSALKRARLDWESVKAKHPALVYASITGYGLAGADADTPAFDNAAFWSRSGMAHMTKPAEVDPFSVRQGSGDHTCGMAAALGIVTALLARTRSGQGRLVEASLLRTGVFVMGADLSNQIRLGEVTPTRLRAAPVNPLNNFYRTADDRWLFFMLRSAYDGWRDLCGALDCPELAEEPPFETQESRLAHSAELTARLDAIFQKFSFDEAGRRLTEADIVWSPVQTPAEVVADPQARAAGCFIEVSDGHGGRFESPAPPVRFDSGSEGVRRPTPALGQHTEEILAEIGLATTQAAAHVAP